MCVCVYIFLRIYSCVSGGMWMPQVSPRHLGMLQNSPQSGAGKGAGRGLLSYGLSRCAKCLRLVGLWAMIKGNIFFSHLF